MEGSKISIQLHFVTGLCLNTVNPLWGRHKLHKSCGDPRIFRRFLPDAYFSRSAAHRPIFLTLNHVVKSASGRLTAAAGRLFGHRPILSSNDQIFGRCPGSDRPEGVQSITAGHQ